MEQNEYVLGFLNSETHALPAQSAPRWDGDDNAGTAHLVWHGFSSDLEVPESTWEKMIVYNMHRDWRKLT